MYTREPGVGAVAAAVAAARRAAMPEAAADVGRTPTPSDGSSWYRLDSIHSRAASMLASAQARTAGGGGGGGGGGGAV